MQRVGREEVLNHAVSDGLDKFYRQAVKRGEKLEKEWRKQLKSYAQAYPELEAELSRRLAGKNDEHEGRDNKQDDQENDVYRT